MKFATVATRDLIIDKRYQRVLNEARVNKLVNEFDPRRLGTLEVAARKGSRHAVFDGQHRLAALRKLSLDKAPCLLHEGLTPQEEAELFVALQRDRRNINPLERFRARVFSGDKTARGMARVVTDCGYEILDYSHSNGNSHPHAIRAITTLERIYTNGSEQDLVETLGLVDLWRGDPKATNGHLIEGCWLLLRRYGDRLDDKARLRLREIAPTVIIRRATGKAAGGGSWTAFAVASELQKVAGMRGRPLTRKRLAA